MTPDRHNIEAILLDYAEGRLDPVETAELMAFLAENPEYEALLPDAGPAPVLTGDSHFPGRHLLKKDFTDVPEISAANFDEFCIAATEGLLTADDRARLDAWLQAHPEKMRDFRLYEKATLQVDPTVVFPRKASLKKGAGPALPIRLTWALLAAAAAVALFVVLVHPSRTPASPVRVAATVIPEPIFPESQPQVPPVAVTRYPEPAASPDAESVDMNLPENHTPHGMESLSPQPMREARINNRIPAPVMVALLRDDSRITAVPEPLLVAIDEGRESIFPPMITSLFRKLDFWKAAETAVSGFNYLTESQVAISRTTDGDGKAVGLALETDQFTIRGNKVK